MGLGCSGSLGLAILVILGLCHGQADFWRDGTSAIQYRYNCGERAMQLLVVPSHGQEVRFKVVADESGTAFEVSNCPICDHWITSHNGAVAFSAGYDGCRVVKKDGMHHLKVRLEELTRNRTVVVHDIYMICPKPQEHVAARENNMRHVHRPQTGLVHPLHSSLVQPMVSQLQPSQVRPGESQPGLLRPVQPGQSQTGLLLPLPPGQVRPLQPGQVYSGKSKHGLVHSLYPGQVHPGESQPGQVRPGQPGLVRPGESEPGQVRPGQPGLVPPGESLPAQVRPGQPGLVRPGESQPGQVRPGQPGLVRPGESQPSQVRPGQPGLVPPGESLPAQVRPGQPGLVRPGESQPGQVRPGQPGLVRPGESQPSQLRPVQPGLVRPGESQPSQVRPGQPGLVRPGESQPGQVRPGQPGLVRPGESLPAQVRPGQPGLVRPGESLPGQLRPVQPGLVRPGESEPGQVRPGQPGQVRPGESLPALVRPGQPGLVRPGESLPGQVRPGQPGLVRPGESLPGQVRPVQPGLVRPGESLPAQVRPGQPGLVRPGESLPAQVRPVQPGLVPPGESLPAQVRPGQPGLVRPGESQPSQVRPVQPGLVPPGESLPAQVRPGQPGLVRPGESLPAQVRPGQPGLVRPGESLPGQVRPGQPGLVRPGESLPAQVRPVQPGLVRPGESLPGQVHPLQPGQVRPGEAQPSLVRPLQPGRVHPEEHYPGQVHSVVLQSSVGRPLTQQQCQVSSERIPCADVQGPTACHQTGCCYDARDHVTPCYYGNTVTVQCLRDGYFILVVSRDMLDYPIILESVRLSYAQAGCSPVRKTESFLVFRFRLTECGTTVQVTGGRLIYENQLISGIDILNGPDGSITRDSIFMLHARCIYNATDFLPLQVEVFLPPSPAPIFQAGPLRLELHIATDSSYTSYYSEYPIVKILREPVHVEIRILQRMDPSLVLVLHECWATPSSNPLEQLQWPILVDGCPFEGDNYRTQLVPRGPATSEFPFPNHYQRFIIYTFTFVDSAPQMVLDGLVYLFCSVSVCHLSHVDSCRVACQIPVASRDRRFLKKENETESLDLVSTYGAVIFQESIHEKQVKWESDMISSEDLTLVLMVVLPIIGIILFVAMLVLWKKKSRMAKL
ncbi:zona pellucida sperm-binding protein 1 [Liasis olivaceus]